MAILAITGRMTPQMASTPRLPGEQSGVGERSPARRILDERFARGELDADQYREHLRVLGE
ncbi:hypothetical protein [Salinibacterium sp. ZJ450]|uniref:hypothetical protein n=1 Tax=Salinibacterium sp. ZJ450 TaxID=2708338 RepID=UPI001CD74CC2|nr:hypothetical protein [Salinibacterium sp. ZJ450]